MIRKATFDDAEKIATLYLSARKRNVAFAPLVHSDEEVRAWIAGKLLTKASIWVLEDVSGHIRAMMEMGLNSSTGWIEQLYVDPDYTGLGHGRDLLILAKTHFHGPIRLYTFQANAGARRFYEREGFVAVKFSDGFQNEEHCPDILYEWNGATI